MPSEYGPEFDRFVEHVRKNVVPNLIDSKLFVSITPNDKDQVDVKFAVELGLAIMYDKPIVAVIQPGVKLSEKFCKVVDRWIEMGDPSDPTARDRLTNTLQEMIEENENK